MRLSIIVSVKWNPASTDISPLFCPRLSSVWLPVVVLRTSVFFAGGVIWFALLEASANMFVTDRGWEAVWIHFGGVLVGDEKGCDNVLLKNAEDVLGEGADVTLDALSSLLELEMLLPAIELYKSFTAPKCSMQRFVRSTNSWWWCNLNCIRRST